MANPALLLAALLSQFAQAAPQTRKAAAPGIPIPGAVAPAAPQLQLPALGVPSVPSSPAPSAATPASPSAQAQAAGIGRALESPRPGSAQARGALDGLYLNSRSLPGPAEAPAELGRRRFAPSYRAPADGKIKVAFFDADSTLRVSLSGSVSANGPRDVKLLPWVGPKLRELASAGYLIVIVSNQNGIPRHVSLENSDAALNYAVELIRAEGGEAHYYDFAEKRNGDRKPGIGMASRLEQRLREQYGASAAIDKSASYMVGDSAYKKGDTRPGGKPGAHFSNSDRLFAEAYGIPFHEPTDFFGWRRHGIDVFTKASEVDAFLRRHPAP